MPGLALPALVLFLASTSTSSNGAPATTTALITEPVLVLVVLVPATWFGGRSLQLDHHWSWIITGASTLELDPSPGCHFLTQFPFAGQP
jgi:predicted permease